MFMPVVLNLIFLCFEVQFYGPCVFYTYYLCMLERIVSALNSDTVVRSCVIIFSTPCVMIMAKLRAQYHERNGCLTRLSILCQKIF